MGNEAKNAAFPSRTVAVIPSAGGLRGMWSGVSSASCDAMLPVAGKPAIYWTLQELLRIGIRRAAIVVGCRGNDLERFATLLFGSRMELRFIRPDAMNGVGYSVRVGTELFEANIPVLVILGDTIACIGNDEPRDKPFVHVSTVRDEHRWCMARVQGDRVVTLVNKPTHGEGLNQALTGIYYFPSGLPSVGEIIGGAEMSDLLAGSVASGELFAVTSPQWLDVGNADHVFEAQARLLQARSFNRLEVDHIRGTITKRSTYEMKFFDEINYYKLLPERLTIYFPRVVAGDVLPSRQSLTMEFYGYPSLADLFVFGNLSPELWKRIFSRLREVCADFHGDDYGPGAGMVDEIHVEKNRERLARFIGSPPAVCAEFVKSSCPTVNGRKVIPMGEAFSRSESALRVLCRDSRLSVIHGDMCLSNILCEPTRGLVKFIDPRGSFGRQGVVGDPRYDMAKLRHSVIGLYDFIVGGICRVSVTGDAVTLEIPAEENLRDIQNAYHEAFGSLYDRREVELLTAWLFLSMLPLHTDSPERQLALAARGLELLTDILP